MRVHRTLLYLFFAGLLATPVIIGRMSDPIRASASMDSSVALETFGFFLEEVAHESGIDFVHRAPNLDPRLKHIEKQVAAYGASVSVSDVNRDGWPDLYLTNSAEGLLNSLYINRKDGTFEDLAIRYNVANLNQAGTGVSMGSIFGDYDNDGFEDLLVYKWGRPELYHNDGGERFSRVTETTGFPDWINSNTALWLDFNRDGLLDVFIGGYYPEDVNLWHLETTHIMPESLEYARNGGRNFLFLNLGNGKFEDVTEQAGLSGERWTLASGAADLRGTGYPDLILANDFGIEDVFLNDGGRRFVNVGSETGIGFAPKSGMSVSFGDIANDGNLSIYVSNISEPGFLLQGNNLWVPRSGDTARFDNLASVYGIEFGGWSYGAQFGDFNSDGAIDLYLVNGLVSDAPGTDYWYDMASFQSGSAAIIRDASNWPDMKGRSLSGYQRSVLWLNKGQRGFENVAPEVGSSDDYDGRAVALVDLWNRGVLDIVVANQRGPVLVYGNTVAPDRHWIDFELEGRVSNRSAVGARVTVVRNRYRHIQQVSGGSGFASQSQRSLHFGLGADPEVEYVVIEWPSGILQRIDQPPTDRVHHIVEPSPEGDGISEPEKE